MNSLLLSRFVQMSLSDFYDWENFFSRGRPSMPTFARYQVNSYLQSIARFNLLRYSSSLSMRKIFIEIANAKTVGKDLSCSLSSPRKRTCIIILEIVGRWDWKIILLPRLGNCNTTCPNKNYSLIRCFCGVTVTNKRTEIA